jgi:hypothetical protein
MISVCTFKNTPHVNVNNTFLKTEKQNKSKKNFKKKKEKIYLIFFRLTSSVPEKSWISFFGFVYAEKWENYLILSIFIFWEKANDIFPLFLTFLKALM